MIDKERENREKKGHHVIKLAQLVGKMFLPNEATASFFFSKETYATFGIIINKYKKMFQMRSGANQTS
jgi:hypothetical protein